METLKIRDSINMDFAVRTDDGDIIFKILDRHFQNGEKVTLNFIGISILTTAFLNAAIGQLYSKYTSEDIASKLKLEEISNSDLILVKTVIQRAKEYFSNKERFDKNVEGAIYGTD